MDTLAPCPNCGGHTLYQGPETSAGGGYDLWPRFIAPYLTRYIPGNPDIIPQNMPGAGGRPDLCTCAWVAIAAALAGSVAAEGWQ